jgi:phage terminase large subunit-like protein
VAALYEQGRVHHLGTLPQLEDQICCFVPASHGNVDLRPAGYSPNRVDAPVWAFTDLLLTPMPNQGIFDLYRQLVQKSRS